MIETGKTNLYYWIEIVSDNYNMESLLDEFPEIILGENLAIVSFDSDSFKPTNEEINRGWIYENEIAYFDKIDQYELAQPSLFDIYDQWLIFDSIQRIQAMDIYVNYVGFSVSPKSFSNQGNIVDRFWDDIIKTGSQKFILNGDKLIIGTKNKIEFEKIKASSQQHLS